MTTIPYGLPGVASFELTDDYVNQRMLNGSFPPLDPASSAEAGDDLERFHVVGYDSSFNLIPATWDADPDLAVKPIGITAVSALTGERVLFHVSGHWNLDILTFDASFNTDAKKINAFIGAPTPTAIKISSRA